MELTKVCVWPEEEAALTDAVEEAGGQIVSAAEAEVIVSFNGSVERMRSALHPGVRWVQLGSAGIEKWIAGGVISAERSWTACSGLYAEPMAEHGLALLLAAACDLPRRAKARTWGPYEWGEPGGQRLHEKTVGIVGCGGVGKALIRLLVPFRVKVMTLTRSGRAVSGSALSVGPDGIDVLLQTSDFVVLAAPATSETRNLISRRAFERMRETAWLVNLSRGRLVDTDALVEALRNGVIAGAALDVVEPEPLPDGHPLWSLDNALVTPHVGCPRDLCITLFARRLEENLCRFRADQPLVGQVTPGALY